MNEIVLCSVNVGDWTKDALSTWIIMILNYNVQIPCRIPPVIRSNPGSLFGTRFWAASAHSTPVFPRPPSFPCTPLFQSGRDGLPANAVSGNQSRYPCPERPPRDGYPRHLTDSSPRDHFPDTPSPTPLRETAFPDTPSAIPHGESASTPSRRPDPHLAETRGAHHWLPRGIG
jgi:hypothetical protein